MKKNTKAPTGAACTSTVNTMKCALTGEHTEHSSSAKRSGQHMRWSARPDGSADIATYQGSKKGPTWTEDAGRWNPGDVLTVPATVSAAAVAALSEGEAPARELAEPRTPPGLLSAKPTKPKKSKPARDEGPDEDPRIVGYQGGPNIPMPIDDSPSVIANGAVEDNGHAKHGLRILGMRRHPAAALFPLMEGDELETFIARIVATKGPRDPIVRVTVGGETFILDGSNRGIACERLGITPRFADYEGPKDIDSLVAYSIDKNGDGRRHLDPSIRAMIVVESVKLLPRGNPGETGRSAGLTQAEAGKKLGVSERLVRRAAVVQKEGSAKLKDAVMKGKLAVDAAEKVARLPKAKQDEIADEALARKSGQMKTGRVVALARQEEKRAIVRKINEQRVAPMPAGPFGVIYGDYPWLYENSDQHEGSRGHMGYPPMALDQEQLAAARDKGLQVSDLTILDHAREAAKRAANGCIVALWTTNLYLLEMKRVLEAYGATHRTVYTWPKPRAGVGTWGRGQTEHLIIASIGEPHHTLNENSTLLESFSPHVVGEHSSKPEEVAELLAEHCAGPFLELFARNEREGWVCWGAEVDRHAEAA